MATWRLFIAVELPDDVRRLLGSVVRELAATGADVKWSRPESMHLTLKFLGDTAEEEVANLARVLDAAAAAGRPHAATLGGLGAFPDLRRPRVLWIGLDEPSGELVALQKRIEEATRYLAEPDPRGFEGHLTLGRVRSSRRGRELSEMMQGYRLESKLAIPVREIVLIRSVLGRDGPTYTPLHRSRIG